MMTSEQILREAHAIADYMTGIRRDLHRHPELGRKETRTQALILKELQAMGIECKPCADTGVVAVIRGGKPGKTIGLRADIDALPIQEDTGLEYASENPGVMHACGHDTHAASLLGAAKLLKAHESELQGNVKLFFQPDEEGQGGGQRMVDEGCMEGVDAVFGGHNSTSTPAGGYGLKYGDCYAASNVFSITVKGKGCHGAYPGSGIDPIVVASQIVVALQTLTSRRIYATDSAVVTVGVFNAGTAGNIIPGEAKMRGTFRTFGPEMRAKMSRMFLDLVEGVARSMGAEAIVELSDGYPGVVNHDGFSALVEQSMVKLVGRENVRIQREPNMGTEDFGAFMKDLTVPGAYCDFGFGDGHKECVFPAHNAGYRTNEAGLPYAAALFVQVVQDFLEG